MTCDVEMFLALLTFNLLFHLMAFLLKVVQTDMTKKKDVFVQVCQKLIFNHSKSKTLF